MSTPELEAAAATPLGGAKTPSPHAMKIEIEKRAPGGGGGGDLATPVTEVGVARATRMAMQAKAQVETLLTFGDLDADYVEAAPTNKMILTPLLGGVSSELIEVDESNRAAKTCAFLKKNWLFTAEGRHSIDEGEYSEERFAAAFPEGLRAFSSCRDQKETTQQVAVLVAAAYAMVVFQTLVSLDFGVIVTGGRAKTITNAAVIVEASQGSGRRKVNVTPADVVRGLSLQSGERCIGVVYDKDEYPGQRIYILNLSDEKFNEAYEQGGYRLLGDKRYFPIPYKPRSGIHKIYMHTGLHAIEAVENDAVPQLAGWLGVPPSQINVSLVGGNLIARDVCVICFAFPYTIDAYDQAFELTQRRVVKLINPRKPRLGGMTAYFTANLDDMQTTLNTNLLLPPRTTVADDDEEFVPLPIIPRDLLEGPRAAASATSSEA